MSRAEGSPNGGDQQVVRWYTRARRFPQLIGRTPDGARIPGGPYTITQVATAGVLMLIALKTTSLWAHYGLLANGLLLAGVVYGVVFLLGKIPLGSRNPLVIAAGAWRALTSPSTGRLGGRPVRLRGPHRVQHRMTVFLPAAAPTAAAPEPMATVPPAPVAEPSAVPAPAGAQLGEQAEPSDRRAKTSRRRSKARSSLGHRRLAPDPAGERLPTVAPAAPVTAPSQPQPPAPAPAAAPALSGVQALLAQGAASSATSPTTPRNS